MPVQLNEDVEVALANELEFCIGYKLQMKPCDKFWQLLLPCVTV